VRSLAAKPVRLFAYDIFSYFLWRSEEIYFFARKIHYYIRALVLIFMLLVWSALIPSICLANTTEQHFIPVHADWKYRAKPDRPPEKWHQLEFDDSSWLDGPAGFGYGDNDDRTVLNSMQGNFGSIQIRHRFFVDRPTSVNELFLYLRYDDAFIAYVNGKEVARAGVEQQNTRIIVTDHEAMEFEPFSIVNPKTLLRQGWNVLAIEGFNRSLNSSDFSLDPVLTPYRVNNPGMSQNISREAALADLRTLERRFNDQSSYLRLRNYNFKKAFSALRMSADETVDTRQFALGLKKLIARLGDAHADVSNDLDDSNSRYLSFVLADTRDGVVALKADHSGFVDNDYPFIVAMDGKTMASWVAVASQYVSQASTQLIRHRSLQELRAIAQMRGDLGIAASDSIKFTLQSHDGRRQIKKSVPLGHERLRSGKIPIGRTRILNGNIGYLRIAHMKNSHIKELILAMDDFKNTDGLIIDVRDNTGGRYGILEALYGYFIPENASPYVTNIAAYRLSSRFAADHLHYRPTYDLAYQGWTNSERQVIKKALAVFRPEWVLPDGLFSPWHIMLLGHSGSSYQYHYTKPVAVLGNAASFSATDGFLSAFADLSHVALIGQPSSGGSGATQRFKLPNSGIQIALSSMASFRPNGKLYDGNGIDVDINIMPAASDFLGKTDAALRRATEWVTDSQNESLE